MPSSLKLITRLKRWRFCCIDYARTPKRPSCLQLNAVTKWMLQNVFEADRCQPGKDFASVLLNLSCSCPVVTKNPSHHCDAIIVDPHLLSFTVQCWKHWQRYRDSTEGNTLDVVLHTLQHLLRDNHRYRDFNVKQMERAGILELVLHLARVSYTR